jgi:hypothetical protein
LALYGVVFHRLVGGSSKASREGPEDSFRLHSHSSSVVDLVAV